MLIVTLPFKMFGPFGSVWCKTALVKFDLKYFRNKTFFHYEKIIRRTTAWHHHGSDTPTSARAVLHHTDPNGPNILKESVCTYMKPKLSTSTYLTQKTLF